MNPPGSRDAQDYDETKTHVQRGAFPLVCESRLEAEARVEVAFDIRGNAAARGVARCRASDAVDAELNQPN